jgi:hypothetical protein
MTLTQQEYAIIVCDFDTVHSEGIGWFSLSLTLLSLSLSLSLSELYLHNCNWMLFKTGHKPDRAFSK